MIEFKIRPDKQTKYRRKGGFFRVYVASSLKEVRRIYGHNNKRVVAFVHTGRVNKIKGKTCLGHIFFPPEFGNRIMTHEAAHAALYFLLWQQAGVTFGRKLKFKSDETIPLAVGDIAREITVGLYKKGVWK